MKHQYIDFEEFIINEIFIKYSITRTELCKKLKCSRSTLNNFVSGKTKVSLTLAKKIENLFPNNEKLRAENIIKYKDNTVADVPYFIPNFFKVTSTKIKNWLEENPEDSQKQLPVLIRRLILSTCHPSDISECNFPGNDDYRKPGQDGHLKSNIETLYIPYGESHWEFGINLKASSKITNDFDKAEKKHNKDETKSITYVAVTPQKLSEQKKKQLKEDLNKNNIWKDIIIYDSTDLEQWLEISLPGQAYFSEIANINRKGIESLDSYWNNFSKLDYKKVAPQTITNNLDFKITTDFFDYYIQKNKKKIISFYETEYEENEFLYIAAESIEEGIAFIYSLLSSNKKNKLDKIKAAYVENSLYVNSEEQLNDIVNFGVKAELSLVTTESILKKVKNPNALKRNFKTIVICSQTSSLFPKNFPFNLGITHNLITLYPLPLEKFLNCLYKQNIPSDVAHIIAKETGCSVNTLSILYSENREILMAKAFDKIKKFSKKNKKCLIALASVQSISQDNSKDVSLVNNLSETENSIEILEDLAHKKYSFVWKENNHLCIISKYTILVLLQELLTEKFFSNFFKELNQIFFDKRIYNHYSYQQINFLDKNIYLGENILKSLMDTLCLFSSKINELDILQKDKTYFIKEKNLFINKLLSLDDRGTDLQLSTHTDNKNTLVLSSEEQVTTDRQKTFKEKFIFLFPFLSLIAEIAPDHYLEFIKKDIYSDKSVIKEFFERKVKNIYEVKANERNEYRCDILRSLEYLAWNYKYFQEIIDILTELSYIKINDNLQNKPFNSLKEIFRIHYPQTYVGDTSRLKTLKKILTKDRELGVKLIKSILNDVILPPSLYLIDQPSKWITPDYELIEEYNNADPTCYMKGALSILSDSIFSKEQRSDKYEDELAALISYLPIMDKEEINLLLEKIKETANNSDDNFRIKFKECINKNIKYERIPNTSKNILKNFLKKNESAFEVKDPLITYSFVLKNEYVSPYCTELGFDLSDKINDQEFELKIEAIRHRALREIYKVHGLQKLTELAEQSPASFFIGKIIREKGSFIKKDLNHLLTNVLDLIVKETNLTILYNLTEFIRGYFFGKEESEIPKLITRYCNKNKVLPINLIVNMPLSLKLFKNKKFFKNETEENFYWRNLKFIDNRYLEGDDLLYSIESQLNNNRLDFLYQVYSIKLLNMPNDDLVTILNKTFILLNLPENKEKIAKIDKYILIKIINNISEDNTVSFDEKLILKFHYLPFLIKSENTNIREIELFFEQRPECFVDYFKSDFLDKETIEYADKDRIVQDYFFKNDVISAFKHIPGQIENTNKINSTILEKWINNAQKYAKTQEVNIDRVLGKLLIYGPREDNVLFPSFEVCSLFEKICNQDIQKYLYLEIINGAERPIITVVDGGEAFTAIKMSYEELLKKYPKRDYPHTNELVKAVIKEYAIMAKEQEEEEHLRHMGVEKF